MKRILALVLTLTMLLSVFAMSAAAATTQSSLSSSYDTYANVTIGILDEEDLAQYPAKKLVQSIEDYTRKSFNADTIVWAVSGDDNYTITSIADGTMDLSSYAGRSINLQTIIGNGKQLDYTNNTVVRVYLHCQAEHIFSAVTLEGADADGNPVTIGNQQYSYSYNSADKEFNYFPDYYPAIAQGTKLTAVCQLNNAYPDAVTFYEGYYGTAEEAEASGMELANVVDGSTVRLPLSENSGSGVFTAVVTAGEHKFSRNLYIYARERSDSYGTSYPHNAEGYSIAWTSDWQSDSITYYTYSNYPANAEYYFRIYAHSGETGSVDASIIEYAYVDGGTEDIKDQLFGNKGYLANYSGNGHTFTFKIKSWAKAKSITIKLVDSDVTIDSQTPSEDMDYSGDTYFQVRTAVDENGNRVPAYIMPSGADSLYRNSENCYQTVLMKPDKTMDETQLKPVFGVHEGTEMFAQSVGAEAAVKQISGESIVDFSNGAVEYTAKDASGSGIKNYWVNFAQKHQDAKLFVNGPAFDELQTDEVDEADKREVLLGDQADFHDVFIANLGSADLTGLSVSLDEEAQKTLALDEYFVVGGAGNDILPAFNSTYVSSNQAAAKIRLRLKDAPENLETSKISGIMTVTSAAGTKYIYLTGMITPKIVTDTMPNGVKYVPYSVMVQTNNHDDSNKVTFGLVKGSLPEGVELNTATGEIYGVPKQTGTFNFTVSAAYSNHKLLASEKDFSITIEDNTDFNVLESCDDTILVYVHDMGYFRDTNSGHEYSGEYIGFVDQVFEMDHEFDEFVKFFLDGEELVRGTDYNAEEGSTKVTILAKTFRNAGNGTHTIAAEFRNPGTNEMYKNAQNYTAEVRGSSSGSSSSNKQEQPKEEPVSGWPFDDVRAGQWFYQDVQWAFDNGYMVGVSSRLFAPDNMISLPMVVTTLARMSGADLEKYAAKQYQEKYSDIPAGMWFSEAAVWAKEMGLLTDEPFKVEPPLGRSDFAVILVKYLELMGVDVDPTAELAVFADADLMTAEENRAFQVLHYYGIFNGVGNNCMDPDGATTRAQLAALLHRLSDLEEKYN